MQRSQICSYKTGPRRHRCATASPGVAIDTNNKSTAPAWQRKLSSPPRAVGKTRQRIRVASHDSQSPPAGLTQHNSAVVECQAFSDGRNRHFRPPQRDLAKSISGQEQTACRRTATASAATSNIIHVAGSGTDAGDGEAPTNKPLLAAADVRPKFCLHTW